MKNQQLKKNVTEHKLNNFAETMMQELILTSKFKDVKKDIIIIVKNQIEYVVTCIESIFQNTDNFNLFIWDNASEPATAKYLQKIAINHNVYLHTNKTNEGFIVPNNRLIEKTNSPYIILLNSDTVVKKGWDKTMIAMLESDQSLGAVGYSGCKLDADFKGGLVSFCHDIDYLAGWSLCLPRKTYEKFGLFDERNLEFAYCEDADFSLRLKESGLKVYAIVLELVEHFENRTISKELEKDEDFKEMLKRCFDANHQYLKERWSKWKDGEDAKISVLHNSTNSW